MFQPRFVVHNFREFVKRKVRQNGGGVAQACCNVLHLDCVYNTAANTGLITEVIQCPSQISHAET